MTHNIPDILGNYEAGQTDSWNYCIREEDILKCKDKLARIEEELKLLQNMHKDKHLTHFRSVAFLQGFTGNGLFLMEGGLGMLSPCHLDDT